MRRPWGLRVRVLAAGGLIAVVSAITFALLLNALHEQQRAAGPAREVTDARNAIASAQRLTRDMQRGVRGYLLTGDESLRTPFDLARRELPYQIEALAAVRDDTEQRPRIDLLRRQAETYTASLDSIVARMDRSRETALDERLDFDELRLTLIQLDRYERRELMRRREVTADLRRQAIVTASGGLAVLLALIALISYGAVRSVVIPVGRLQTFARELGARRYGARLPESGPPETIELAQAFNATATNLAASEAELRRIGERYLAELDAVFGEAPLGLAFVDRDLRYLRVNDALARMNGRAAADHIGRRVQHPDAVAALERVLATGQPVLDIEIAVDGHRFEASYFPVLAGGEEPVAVGAAVSDVEARRQAEDARQRLQHATATLAAAVTVTDVAETAVAEARAAFDSDGAALLLVRGEWLELAAIDGLNASKHGRLAQVALGARRPTAESVRTGRPVHVRTPEEMAERFPELADVPALVAFPLVTAGDPLGVLLIDFTRPRTLEAGEHDLLAALATQCAIALARAQLYERERDVAQTLQASLLPRGLPSIPGLDLAAELNAGTIGLDVGGDFYDAFTIAPDVWGIAIGDVCGKGVDAAALTALARHTVRAAAVEGAAPSHVLRALNRAVLAEGRPGQFLTAVFARLIAHGDGFAVTLACGGHPPPVLLDPDGNLRALECTGTLLGVLEDPRVHDVETRLAPGDTLLLYTDGLTEAGAPARTLSTEDVGDLLRAARASHARETALNCLAAAAQAGGGAVRDDVAVLVAQAGSTAGRTAPSESSTRGQ
ncbi:SpoIIE family protein phosphatase [Solirubrobacter sp. CPCC 204708]|uniref:SpoIIE family protein phosphatase n=1 Tax=Solirubrobacter deserti TaxID=2282478 RepID=A0ABT4RG39_9ACTN|nr:SpoIIE family protein phosphatase [Solirubrobacter deserti]MBE2318208.1 SpoIIE family protein phosphatase [Solirubrobacter deserti]MDA0137489.1 SpoIIE family protein phosphatase [Solirubrobacter deserti]